MNESSHTVTIPIKDYNELLKAKEMIGATILTPKAPLYEAIFEACSNQYKKNGRVLSQENFQRLTFFIKGPLF